MMFGDNLKEIRKKMGLSQKELGDRLELGQTTIANYEKNIRFPGPKTLIEIADFFDVSLDVLMGRGFDEVKAFSKEEIDNIKEQMLMLLMNENEKALMELIDQLAFNEERLIQFYELIISDILATTGSLWEEGKITVAKEHYISYILDRIISVVSKKSGIYLNEIKGNAIALTLASEPHTLGLKMISDYLRMFGFRIYFLGTNVPTDALTDMIIKTKPKLLAISITMPYHLDGLKNLIQIITSDKNIKRALGDKMKIVAGGKGMELESRGADLIADDFDSLKKGLIKLDLI